jgi:hypothetical protein
MNMDHNSTRSTSFLRDRVHAFEHEMGKAINGMADVETDIKNMNDMRREWLTSVCGADEIDLDTYMKRLDLFKKRAEIVQVEVEEDAITLDTVYEKQQLNMLVEATKPLEGDETDEMRERKLTAIALEGTNEMRASLERSVTLRRTLADASGDMVRNVDMARIQYEQKGIMRGDEIKRRISGYIQRLQELLEKGNKGLRNITRDYLILRHNAKVASEILKKSENDAHRHREELQFSLEAVVAETAVHMDRMEHGCKEELMKLTQSVRSQVIKREQELEELRQKTFSVKIDRKMKSKHFRKAITENEILYEKLQDQRKKEIKEVNFSLRELKSGMLW